ncbi:glomulin-like [Watersipora subatra]|uniref:glomulin-like n=1 Tax=Watersipora subatra TaxID=2589382 RepID=UPI00355B79C4
METQVDELAEEAAAAVRRGDDKALHTLFSRDINNLDELVWPMLTRVNELLESASMSKITCSTYSTLLQLASLRGKPKELVYAYLESCEAFQSSVVVCGTVPLLASALAKIPENERSLEVVCNTLDSHIRSCPWTRDDYVIADDDANDLTRDPVIKLHEKTQATTDLLHLVTTVVEEFAVPMTNISNDTMSKEAMSEMMTRLAHYPLLYTLDEHVMPTIVSALSNVHPTLTKLLFRDFAKENTIFAVSTIIEDPLNMSKTSESLWMPGLGAVLYAVLYDGCCVQAMPSVHTPQFQFISLLPTLHSLFIRCSHKVVALKTTRLLEYLLNRIGAGDVDETALESALIKETIAFLCWGMQFSDLLTVRQSSARLLPVLCSKFTIKGQYYLLQHTLSTQTSPEILSYVYTLVKDFVHHMWSSPMAETYQNYALNLMEKIFCPPEGEGGQLIGDLNKISSALNLARYLVNRDKRRTAAQTRDMMRYIKDYIKPVGKCLRSELNGLEERLKTLNEGSFELSEMSVDVGSETINCGIDVEKEATLGAINKVHLVLHVYDCLADSLAL